MPREYRRLYFSEDELMDAIEAHDEVASQRLEDQPIHKVESNADEDGNFRITLENDLSDGGKELDLPPHYIVAAMMRFCIDEGVPLPRRGSKSLEFENGECVLVVEVDHEVGAGAAAA